MKKNILVLFFYYLNIISIAQNKIDSIYFFNPVINQDWPDPTIWKGEDSCYYSLSTTGAYNARIKKSTDLVEWVDIEEPIWDKKTVSYLSVFGKNIWAPQVIKINNQWLIYLTCIQNARHSSIIVLTADTTKYTRSWGGPWKYKNMITSSVENNIIDTIDPFVVQDTTTSKNWLFFGSSGGIHRVQLSDDGLNLSDSSEFIPVAGLHIKQNPSRSKVFEGVYLYYHLNYWYIFISSGNYNNYTYNIKVGRSKSLEENFFDKEGKPLLEGNGTTILSSSKKDFFFGPGHNGEIITDLNNNTYFVYHCHNKEYIKPGMTYLPRQMMLQQIFWDEEGWPFVLENKPQIIERKPKLQRFDYSLDKDSIQILDQSKSVFN